MRSIVKSIANHAAETPHKNAIIATDHTIDYKSLWAAITQVNVLLKNCGIKKGDRIILEAGPTVEYLVGCYAIHLAGAVQVPVEKNVPRSRIDEIAEDIQPSMILDGKRPLQKLGFSLEDFSNSLVGEYVFPTEDMLQEILYTTGTTGKSKGVMITHYGQMNMCESQNAVLSYSKDNVWMIPTPMNHAAGLRKVHMSMVHGSTVVIMGGFTNLKLFFDNMRRYRVTSLYLPPSGVHYVLTLAGNELAKFDEQLDFIYSSSAALPSVSKENLIELLPNVRMFDAYGGSEVGAVVYIDYNAVQGDARRVGKPNPGVEVFIVDDNYQVMNATENRPGIIAVRSNTVTAGYWNEPELTAETIRDGVIYMSDLGFISEDGYLYLIGRRDDVINIGGFKVAPTEVEDVAQRIKGIVECACIPYEDKMFGRCLKMLVVLKDNYCFDATAISDYMESKLEAYKIPKIIDCVREIPKTFNGKIDRKRLIEMHS